LTPILVWILKATAELYTFIYMACWLQLTSIAVVTEELSVSDSDLSSGLNPSPKVSPAADTLQDQQETVSPDTHQDERI